MFNCDFIVFRKFGIADFHGGKFDTRVKKKKNWGAEFSTVIESWKNRKNNI